jgi:hypothetical protein
MQYLNKIAQRKSFSLFMVGLLLFFSAIVTINANDNYRLLDQKNSSQIVKVAEYHHNEIIRTSPDGTFNITPERFQTTQKFHFSSNVDNQNKLTSNILVTVISKDYCQPDNLSAFFTVRLLL